MLNGTQNEKMEESGNPQELGKLFYADINKVLTLAGFIKSETLK